MLRDELFKSVQWSVRWIRKLRNTYCTKNELQSAHKDQHICTTPWLQPPCNSMTAHNHFNLWLKLKTSRAVPKYNKCRWDLAYGKNLLRWWTMSIRSSHVFLFLFPSWDTVSRDYRVKRAARPVNERYDLTTLTCLTFWSPVASCLIKLESKHERRIRWSGLVQWKAAALPLWIDLTFTDDALRREACSGFVVREHFSCCGRI